jgi:Uma2 family endonuclease
VLVPDLAAWRCERMRTVPNVADFTMAPDWLCEIISPSSVRHDRIAKMRCYARAGVAWAWLVDRIARTLETFRLDGPRWTVMASHAGDEVARVEPFAEPSCGSAAGGRHSLDAPRLAPHLRPGAQPPR